MTKLIVCGRAAAAAALSLAACNKPASEPADAPAPASAPAAAAPAPAATPASALPADVEAQRENAEACEHFPGEEPYDAARAKEIEEGVEKYCGALKAALPALKTKYAGDAAVTAQLNAWQEFANVLT